MNWLSLSLLLIQFTDQPRTLLIRVVNSANIPDNVLARAGEEVQRIYRRAGIPTIWRLERTESGTQQPAANETDSFRVVVVITADCINKRTCQDKSVMGTALGSGRDGIRRAYVFSDRVYEMAWKFHKRIPVPKAEGLVMGHAIAHEVGHLMLPPPGHSRTGLMAASMDLPSIQNAVRGDLLFTALESALMRATLSGPPSAP